MKILKVAMIHDLVCSWCANGYNNIKQVLINVDIEANFYFLPLGLDRLEIKQALSSEEVDQVLAAKQSRVNNLGTKSHSGIYSKRRHLNHWLKLG